MEIWESIRGYWGLYEVSSFGRVKSLERNVTYTDGRSRYQHEIILSPEINCRGYHVVSLYKRNKKKRFCIHILVATVFLDQPIGKCLVNHNDGDKLNNHLSNLSWADHSDNIEHAYAHGLRKSFFSGKVNELHPRSKAVIQMDSIGQVVKRWGTATEAGRNGYRRECITLCCTGKILTHKGYFWKYA